MKNRSKIIKDLIVDNINVLQAMQSLNFILEDIDNEKIQKWVNHEINGYQKNDNVPNYRKTNTMLIGTVQVGYAVYNNINIPLSDANAIEAFTKLEIREPISTTNGDVISAHRELSIYAYSNVVGMIKDKLLEIFKILEKNYGNLDALYIDFSDNLKKDEIAKALISVVNNDNSIKIGNNNQFKDSVIGDENEN